MTVELIERYGNLGLDLPDATIIAMAAARHGWAWAWDLHHFRVVVLKHGTQVPLVVTEAELPSS